MSNDQTFIASVKKIFHAYKSLADKALVQVPDEVLHLQHNEDSNSLATIMQHMAGNMLSRWTDFYTTDGEKENRNRDGEFVDARLSREDILAYWEKGWNCCFHIIDNLKEEDLERTVYIRKEAHTVIDAINRQVAHYSYHVGQIVYVCKMYSEKEWQTLTIARNKSGDFNKTMGM